MERGTVSRRTAKNKMTKLYWPSRKLSPKRLIVFVEPKKLRVTTTIFLWKCPTFNVFRRHCNSERIIEIKHRRRNAKIVVKRFRCFSSVLFQFYFSFNVKFNLTHMKWPFPEFRRHDNHSLVTMKVSVNLSKMPRPVSIYFVITIQQTPNLVIITFHANGYARD